MSPQPPEMAMVLSDNLFKLLKMYLYLEFISHLGLQRFRNWCGPNPDFLWNLVVPSNCMRLSSKKAAHYYLRLVPRCRKSGKATQLFVVSSPGKALLAIF